MTRRPGFPARLDPAPAPAVRRGAATAVPVRATAPAGVGLDSQAVRSRMVQKLAAQGVSDARVLAAMNAVERHRFVDSALVNQAYEDTSLPIGLGQTISKPNVVARMIELLLAAPGAAGGRLGRVLEIGTGCGYQAAVLSQVDRLRLPGGRAEPGGDGGVQHRAPARAA
jgi:protein-L-isoaspartate(D-aspartate) O-methyltransferase